MTTADSVAERLCEPGERPTRGYWGRFATFLLISVVIASLGLYRNSGALVIAAMLLAPLMTPILGIAAALVKGWTVRLLRMAAFVIVATVATIATAFVLFVLLEVPRGLSITSEVLGRTDPGLEELLVALAAGLAGAYAELRQEEVSLVPGVAIGVSLVPPLCAAGILLYFGEPWLAWEATLLYLTNLAAIVFAAAAVFLVMGLRPATRDRGGTARVAFGTIVAGAAVVVLALQLGASTVRRFQEAREESLVVEAIQEWASGHQVEIMRADVRGELVDVRFVIDVPLQMADVLVAPGDLVSTDLDAGLLAERIRERLARDVRVRFSGQIRYSQTLGG
jgi:uncharacterized hydrophobic protein (TIGR00271 family)